MTLVERVQQELHVDESQAEKGVGLLVLAVRFAVDAAAFSKVKEHVPEAESAMGRALMSNAAPARTGELSALTGPRAMLNGLRTAGYTAEQMPKLATIVLGELRDVLGADVIQRILTESPALKG